LINGKQAVSIKISCPIDRVVLEEIVKKNWIQFEQMKFTLMYEDCLLESAIFSLPPDAKVKVNNICKGFSEFSENEALAYAATLNLQINENMFRDGTISSDTTINTIAQELERRIVAFDLYKAAECTMREFIGPLLVGAVVLNTEVKMVAENKIIGSLGNGPVDYTLIYKEFNICIVEAKKEAIEQGVAQNIAQLVASREEYCHRFKRKAEDICNVPSSGIVSTGEDWIFMRYMYEDGEWNLYRSNVRKITLEEGKSISLEQIEEVLKKIMGMIETETSAIDSIQRSKRYRGLTADQSQMSSEH
jgi:hypothetical protein